jgi:hypothetical protein
MRLLRSNTVPAQLSQELSCSQSHIWLRKMMHYLIYNIRLLFLKSVIYIDLVHRVKLYQLVLVTGIPQLLLSLPTTRFQTLTLQPEL